jgi:hypothetical protein
MKKLVLLVISIIVCFGPTHQSTLVAQSVETEWMGWNTANSDNALEWRLRRISRNGYSGTCDWGFQIVNKHGYTADIRYVVTAVAGQAAFDHKALNQASGSTLEVVLTVSNCAEVFFDAKGEPSS